MVDNRKPKSLLTGKMMIKRTLRYLCLLQDSFNAGRIEALTGYNVHTSLYQLFFCIFLGHVGRIDRSVYVVKGKQMNGP